MKEILKNVLNHFFLNVFKLKIHIGTYVFIYLIYELMPESQTRDGQEKNSFIFIYFLRHMKNTLKILQEWKNSFKVL